MDEATTEAAPSYCVVFVGTGEIVYGGSSLSAAAAKFEPGTVACTGLTPRVARDLAEYVAGGIRARQGGPVP